MKKVLIIILSLVALVATATVYAGSRESAPQGATMTKKRSIMELPLFERAVLIIKKFETLHKPCHWPYVGYGHQVQPGANHTAEAVNSPRHRLTHYSEKTSLSSALSTPNTARIPFFSAHSPTTAVPV